MEAIWRVKGGSLSEGGSLSGTGGQGRVIEGKGGSLRAREGY